MFEYRPDFVPGWSSFDPVNLAVIKELPPANVSLPPLQRPYPDGQWRHWSYTQDLPGESGYWPNLTLDQVAFDRGGDGDAQQLVDLNGAPDGAWFLLHNCTGTQVWVPHRLPYDAMLGDCKGRKADGNLAMMEGACYPLVKTSFGSYAYWDQCGPFRGRRTTSGGRATERSGLSMATLSARSTTP